MDELKQVRVDKRQELMDAGLDPYGRKFEKTDSIKALRDNFEETRVVAMAGRIMLVRGHGKTMFVDLKDETGKMQLYIRQDAVGEELMTWIKKLDVGDIIGVKGKLFLTKMGEPTVFVDEFEYLSKTLLPLPEKFHGLKDQEIRVRQRYLDLVMNDEVRERFQKRSLIIRKIRSYLDERGFMEVETPMMQSVAGGAAARPFITHHNTLDMDLYLRIAPELYLKRLLVGGLEKIYEINRNFRNEGISPRHNPEFTMLELYSAYDNYEDMMDMVEGIIMHLVSDLLESSNVQWGNHTINFASPWKHISMQEAIREYAGIDMDAINVFEMAQEYHMDNPEQVEKDMLMAHMFEKEVEHQLIDPTFIIDFPTILCPLCKTHKDNPDISERFELFIGGQEIANAYSELNDPVEQAERFAGQAKGRDEDEFYSVDHDFVRALEHGMPPAGGLGIGIDRLVMLITGVINIREVILFPQMRKETS